MRFNPPNYAKLAIRGINAIREQGGFSFDANGDEPTSGYMVSLPSENKPTEASARSVAGFLRTNPVSGAQYYGGWRDEQTGAVYLDRSIRVDSLDEAFALAGEYKQLAVYDVANKRTIRVVGRPRKLRYYTIRQRIAYHLRRHFRLLGMAEQARWTSPKESQALRNAADIARSTAEDLSEQLGESVIAFRKRYWRIGDEVSKQTR